MKYISQLTLITAAILLAGNLHCADQSAARPASDPGQSGTALTSAACRYLAFYESSKDYILVPKDNAGAATGLRFV